MKYQYPVLFLLSQSLLCSKLFAVQIFYWTEPNSTLGCINIFAVPNPILYQALYCTKLYTLSTSVKYHPTKSQDAIPIYGLSLPVLGKTYHVATIITVIINLNTINNQHPILGFEENTSVTSEILREKAFKNEHTFRVLLLMC